MVSPKPVLIAGGGLAGCLAALALTARRPELPILLIEGGEAFGGNHIWSFFDGDVDADMQWLVDPLVVARWPMHEVRFPRRRRRLDFAYQSITSERLDAVVRDRLGKDRYRLDAPIAALGAASITLADGEVIEGCGVVDARGAADLGALDLGWQKFVGREYRFAAPHGLDHPIVMDATVDQTEGYRFVYCLPFTPDTMLIEDTYYAESPDLDVETLRTRIDAYVAAQGWAGATLLREEQGVLPVTLGGDFDAFWPAADGSARIGMRGGFFHPTTGYSLPDAVRTAGLLAAQDDMSSPTLAATLRGDAKRLWRGRGFYRLLNRMLLRAAAPRERYRVLEHFYRLDRSVVARFYAGRTTWLDYARILSGRPPVPVDAALKAAWQ